MIARLWLTGILLALAGTAFAQLYKSIDENGNVVYSDVPPSSDAVPVELPPINVIEAIRVAPPAPTSEQPESALPVTYTISIVQPQPDQTFQNTREFPVSVSLEPALQPGHQVAISLDGEVRVRGEELSALVTDVDRGEHRVTAAVVDAGGKPITTSQAVVIFVHRQSLFQRRAPTPR
jgi:hypothetical protein